MQAGNEGPLRSFQARCKPLKGYSAGKNSRKTLVLIHWRADQTNGCAACGGTGAPDGKQAGETDQVLFAVTAWCKTLFSPI
jgi:hypothetical protein